MDAHKLKPTTPIPCGGLAFPIWAMPEVEDTGQRMEGDDNSVCGIECLDEQTGGELLFRADTT